MVPHYNQVHIYVCECLRANTNVAEGGGGLNKNVRPFTEIFSYYYYTNPYIA